MVTGTRGRQTPRPQQGRQTPSPQGGQGNQGKGIPTGTANDGRGRVVNPETDGRIGNNTNPGNRNNEPQQQRTDDLQQTLGPQPAQPQQQQTAQDIQEQQMQDPRMFAASRIMDSAIDMLAVAGRMFKELDSEAGVVQNGNNDNVQYAQGCYDGLQGAIGERMQALDEERGQG